MTSVCPVQLSPGHTGHASYEPLTVSTTTRTVSGHRVRVYDSVQLHVLRVTPSRGPSVPPALSSPAESVVLGVSTPTGSSLGTSS